MVTIANGELQVALRGMQRLAGELMQQKVSPKLMMRLRRMMRAASAVVEDVEQERQRLIKLYAKLDDKDEVVSEDAAGVKQAVFERPEDRVLFEAAYQSLMTVTSEQPEQLTEADLEGVVCQGETVLMLGGLLEG